MNFSAPFKRIAVNNPDQHTHRNQILLAKNHKDPNIGNILQPTIRIKPVTPQSIIINPALRIHLTNQGDLRSEINYRPDSERVQPFLHPILNLPTHQLHQDIDPPLKIIAKPFHVRNLQNPKTWN